MSDPRLFMVFDVESVGLHGEGFAVGYVVVNEFGNELENGCYCAVPSQCRGTDTDRKWISENVPLSDLVVTDEFSKGVRERFWTAWLKWKECGASLFADCAWPVEARFLIACVDDAPEARNWTGPYPLHDVASYLLARGVDPMQKFPRKANEMPEHHPLNDARQSARILLEYLSDQTA